MRNGNRHPTAVATGKSVASSNNRGESPGRARGAAGERMLTSSRSVESTELVLSPETSTALENAEKMINNAKIQLMEIRAMSTFDSAQRSRSVYSDHPPLDDETEELLYIRELVANKFQEANCASRSEADDRGSVRSQVYPRSAQITGRRIDLSAPKFRMSQRQPVDRARSLGRDNDEHPRRQRVASAASSESRSLTSKDSSKDSDEAMVLDDRSRDRRQMSAHRELARAGSGNVCRIQVGPSVHVDAELTRQDLENVHISPAQSFAPAPNVATYTLRHESIAESGAPAEVLRTPKTSRKEKRARLMIAEIESETATSATNEVRDARDATKDECFDHRRDGQAESLRPQIPAEPVLPVAKDAKTSKHLRRVAGRETIVSIKSPGTGDESQVEMSDSAAMPRAKDRKILNKKSGADDPTPRDGESFDKIQTAKRNDRAALPDTWRSSPQRKNIASRRAAEKPKTHRAIECPRSAFKDYDERDESTRDLNAAGARGRLSVSSYLDDSQVEEDLSQVELYRPHLDDLASVLFANDRKLERIVRAANTFAKLLSQPGLASYKSTDEEKPEQRRATRDKFHDESSADRYYDNPSGKPAASSIAEVEPRTRNLTVSSASEEARGAGAHSRNATTRTRALIRAKGDDRGDRSRCSAESTTAYPASDASSGTSRDVDGARQPTAEAARPSESSTDGSDIVTFSNIPPVLSSTRTETEASHRRQEERVGQGTDADDRYADAKRLPDGEVDRSRKERSVTRLLRDLKDATAGRFSAYSLQDEKGGSEEKLTDALTGSAIAPATLRKFLDHLRTVKPIGDARPTETLRILKNILINVKTPNDRAAAGAEGARNKGDDEKIRSRKLNASGMEQLIKDPNNLASRDRRSPDPPCQRVRRNSRRDSVGSPRGESERSARCAESSGTPKDIPIGVRGRTKKSANEGDARDDGEKIYVEKLAAARTGAPPSGIEGESSVPRDERIAEDSRDPERRDARSPDSSEHRQTRGSAEPAAVSAASAPSSERNSRCARSEDEEESLRQVSEIRSEEDPGENFQPPKSARSNEERDARANDADVTIAFGAREREERTVEEGEASNEKRGRESCDERDDEDRLVPKDEPARKSECANDGLDVSRGAPAAAREESEVTIERTNRDGPSLTNKKVSSPLSGVSETRDEDSGAGAPPTRENADLARPSTEENVESSCAIASKRSIAPASSRTADRSRDRASLSSDAARSSESSSPREVESHGERTSRDTAGERDEIRRPNGTTNDRAIEKEDSGLPRSTRSNDESRPDVSARASQRSLSSSVSSAGNTLLDYDSRSNDGVSSAIARRTGTSSEASHSEGELYMPSSCSYSLGEVRLLEKRDLIADGTLDRDSSVTILVTRSMLTSLNDSTTSLLTSSGRI